MTTRMTNAKSSTPIMSLSWISRISLIVLGLVSLFFLGLGFQTYGGENSDQGNMYILLGTAGLAMIGYMFFRTKAVSSQKPPVEKAEVITILECHSCNLKRVRDFQRGDYIYKSDEDCTRCEEIMTIKGIHRKAEPKKKR
ncbi:hypothetical protein CL673_01290 [Candidatus Bathyarchaeota archaeon]|nr:hypothetical protein [Candidatus Bathyarchaeota archaeon]MDP6048437.1 hypothetical protein [Candidatus Bathyarchaeota archaeon]MDP7207109.1 hypothetical protein [Candidatus Bathyarchaeota archaeon]MDP7442924.1 hypothetical protein [Candidatus Bathyarchaeota archaeon]|tara:strand:+ start:7192 stop:7611 length:420 start_codon:yes stop_codon:yes gene_type:complete